MKKLTYAEVKSQIQTAIDQNTAATLELGDLSGLKEQEILLLAMEFPKTTCPLVRALNSQQRQTLTEKMCFLSRAK